MPLIFKTKKIDFLVCFFFTDAEPLPAEQTHFLRDDEGSASDDSSVSEFEPDEDEDLEKAPSRRATPAEFLEMLDYQPEKISTFVPHCT